MLIMAIINVRDMLMMAILNVRDVLMMAMINVKDVDDGDDNHFFLFLPARRKTGDLPSSLSM